MRLLIDGIFATAKLVDHLDEDSVVAADTAVEEIDVAVAADTEVAVTAAVEIEAEIDAVAAAAAVIDQDTKLPI